MHLVGWLGAGTDDRVAAGRAAREGVEVRAVGAHATLTGQRPGLLLGYTALDAEEIRGGVRRLARALQP